MRILPNGAKLIEHPHELPDWTKAKELFLDVETKRIFKAKLVETDEGEEVDYSGLYPFGGDRIAGFAAAADDSEVIYVPMRHSPPPGQLPFGWVDPNLPLENVQRWLQDHMLSVPKWINHNILIDAGFVAHEGVDCSRISLVDTLTLAKMYDSDRLGHGLKAVVPGWGGPPMQEEHRIKAFLKSIKSKSYADVPADLMGHYATDDVLGNRWLYRFLTQNLPAQMNNIVRTETLLTPVLWDMEMRGLLINRVETKKRLAEAYKKMIEIGYEISLIAGREFTNSAACLYDIFTQRMGLPVLVTKWEKDEETKRMYDTGRATYDKDALAIYAMHPLVLANPETKELIDLVLEYRKYAQRASLFYEPFLKLADEQNRIHPQYNQLVRTGRMSCKRPNAQQQTYVSKSLIEPGPGRCFISCDYSQIEFRLIVHYIEDQDAIKSYQDDPWTDFHQWVADMIGIKRKAAKTLNFGMGYGAGKAKVTSELKTNEDIIHDVGEYINELVAKGEIDPSQRSELFNQICEQRAGEAYAKYHETLPGIKATSRLAGDAARRRGYVFNAYGRQRKLPPERSHIAFNTVVQGSAMDLIKEAMVRLSPRYNEWMRERDIHIVANVHDEVLFDAPAELMLDPSVHKYILENLEMTTTPFLVPIKSGLGVSDRNWAEAAGDASRYEDGTVTKDPHDGKIVAGRVIG
jgi:DNA polymerase-1